MNLNKKLENIMLFLMNEVEKELIGQNHPELAKHGVKTLMIKDLDVFVYKGEVFNKLSRLELMLIFEYRPN